MSETQLEEILDVYTSDEEIEVGTRRKPNGYWQNQDNIMIELERTMAENKDERVPVWKVLIERGEFGLIYAIQKYAGGFHKIREKFDETTKKPKDYWINLENVKREISQTMEFYQDEKLPTHEEFNRRGLSSLASAISNYHGGFPTFRRRMLEDSRKPNNYWREEENVIREMEETMKEHKDFEMPSQKELALRGLSSLSAAITKYHGGISNFRSKIDGLIKSKPRGYWKDPSNALAEARILLDAYELKELPSQGFLYENGHSDLSNSISKHHGGFPLFREKLKEHMGLETEPDPLGSLLEEYVGGGE